MNDSKKPSKENLENIGFYFDENGKIKGLNGNKFARYLLTKFQLLYTQGERFYEYKNGKWCFIENIQLSKQLRDVLHDNVEDFWSTGVERNYIEALKREAPYENKLDNNRNYLNLSNGMFNLRKLKLYKHNPEFRSSIQIPIEYNKDAKCPNFKKFLNDIFKGDKELVCLVQEIMGYCLTGETSAQSAFLFFGKGANGKSILAEVFLNLCGKENTSALPLNELGKSFNRFELVDKLLNLATENEVSEKGLNTTYFKTIVAGEPIQVEKKFEQSFMYQPICKMVFLLNNLPYSKDKSWGFQRRLIIIPFNRVFRNDDPETKNYQELLNSLLEELDGILNFALRGLKRLRKNKFVFSKSEAAAEVLKEYREIVNPYHAFVEEMIMPGNINDRIKNPQLVRVFQKWCQTNGHSSLAKSTNRRIIQEIRDVLKDLQIPYEAGENCKSGGVRYTGKIKLKIKNEVEEEF